MDYRLFVTIPLVLSHYMVVCVYLTGINGLTLIPDGRRQHPGSTGIGLRVIRAVSGLDTS